MRNSLSKRWVLCGFLMDNSSLWSTASQGVDLGSDPWHRVCDTLSQLSPESKQRVSDSLSQLPPESKQRVIHSLSQLPPDSWKRLFTNASRIKLYRGSPLPPDSLQRVFDDTIEILKTTKQSGLEEMKDIASPMSQSAESKSQSTHPHFLPSNPSGNNNRLPVLGASQNMQPLAMPISTNRSQSHQLNKNILNNLASLTSRHPIDSVNMLPTQVEQSQEQLSLMQSQPTQLQLQLGLRKQPDELQQDMQPGIETLAQSQRPNPKTSFGTARPASHTATTISSFRGAI